MDAFYRRSNAVYIPLVLVPLLASMAQAGTAFVLAVTFCAFSFLSKTLIPSTSKLVGIIIAVGFVAQLIGIYGFLENDIYSFMKDSWYYFNAIVYVILGAIVYGIPAWRSKFIWALFLAGTLSSLVLMESIIQNYELLDSNAADIRTVVGFGYFDSVVSLVLGIHLFLQKDRQYNKNIVILLTMCSVLAIVFSFSRGIALTSLIGIVALSGSFRNRPLLKLFGVGVCLLIFALLIRGITDLNDPETYSTFLGKIAHIFEEGDLNSNLTFEEINTRWRGYESSVAFDQYISGDILQLLIGQGFGATVDVGVYIALGSDTDNLVRHIEILHNGYMYALLKTGLLGLCLVLYSLATVFLIATRKHELLDEQALRNSDLLLFSVVSLALSTWSTSGIFNKDNAVGLMMLMGYCLAQAKETWSVSKLNE